MPARRTVQTDSRALCYRELDVAGPSGAKLNAAGKSHEILRMGCGPPLISLKAGRLGLNLTAAEYVYILDPWWNPAVEAQGSRPRPSHRTDATRLCLSAHHR